MSTDKGRHEQLLETVTDYAETVSQAGQLEQSTSMDAAVALHELYEQGDWVDEWLEQSPAPKSNPRNWKADARSRFTKWLEWRAQQVNKSALVSRRVYQLIDAAEIADDLTLNRGSKLEVTERTLRPLTWMRKQRHDKFLPDVWRRAVDLAGAESKVTEATVKQALADWKRETLGASGGPTPAKQDQRARQVSKWRSQHHRIVSEFRSFAKVAPRDPAAFQEYKELIREIQEIAIEVRDEAQANAVPAGDA